MESASGCASLGTGGDFESKSAGTGPASRGSRGVAGRGVNLLVFDGFDASRRECVLEAGDEGTSTARVAAGLALRRAASLTGTGGAGAGAGREATAGPAFGP